jgi:hypothetical protein
MTTLNDPVYNRQNMIDLTVPREVHVVGLGGVGFWTALFLAMSGVGSQQDGGLYVYDGDTVERVNLNRLPITEDDIGQKKIDVFARFIKGIRPQCNLYTYGPINDLTIDFLNEKIVVDCTDNPEIQTRIANHSEYSDYVKVSYDGTHITVASQSQIQNRWEAGGETTDGYTFTPSWVVPSVLPSALAVFNLLRKRYDNGIYISCEIGDFSNMAAGGDQ